MFFFAIDTNGNKAIFRLITHAMRLVIGLFSVQILKWLIVLWPNIFCNEWIGNYVTISILVYVVSVKLLQKTKKILKLACFIRSSKFSKRTNYSILKSKVRICNEHYKMNQDLIKYWPKTHLHGRYLLPTFTKLQPVLAWHMS